MMQEKAKEEEDQVTGKADRPEGRHDTQYALATVSRFGCCCFLLRGKMRRGRGGKHADDGFAT